MNPKVDTYIRDGCGRCPLGGTPGCKVNNWQRELKLLRRILLDCRLTEELKWGVPCYTHKGNIVLLSAFKEYCALGFFKGALLSDSEGILEKPGENTQESRLIKFTSPEQVKRLEPVLKAYIFEAIEVERAGLKMDPKLKSAPGIPDEFRQKLDKLPALKAAFEALTPGRQRAYNLYFSAAKQSKTRTARIEKCIPDILKGKGFNER